MSDFNTFPNEGTTKLGIPKSAAVPLIVLISTSIAALTVVLILLGRQEK